MNQSWAWSFLFVFASVSGAGAQSASGQASGDIELGATQPSRVELNGGADGPRASRGRGPVHDDGDIRLALQLRIDAINTLSLASSLNVDGPGPDLSNIGLRLLVPVATPGVRILDDELFLGLGFGFVGASAEDGPNEVSRSGFSLSPLASYDVLDDESAALSLLGWFNLASLGETEVCGPGGCVDQNNDVFGVGLSLGAGLRGFLTEGVALGGEFGWGFLSASQDDGADLFVHGIFANLLLEASIML